MNHSPRVLSGPLEKAYASLLVALEAHQAAPGDALIRDALIQRFEYSYELAWKLMKRYLEVEHGEEDPDRWSRRDLFRIGAETGLIASPDSWFEFMRMRNLTSHTYNEETAQRVAAVIPGFAKDCGAFIDELTSRLSGSASH